jgi:predicted dehydrogenase
MDVTRWGILGTGAIAELFVAALRSLPGAKVQAVSSRTKERASQFAARFGIPVAMDELDKFLGQADLDVVYVASRNEDHRDHCMKAIQAGKAVLCEKPFALTVREAGDVVQLARSRGVFCMEAMWMRFAPAVRETLRLAREGELGDLRFFSGQLGFPYFPDPESRLFHQPGGGALLDLGVYPLSLAQALLGSPTRVISSAVLAPTGVDEQFSAVLDYAGGSQAVIAASLNAKLANSAAIHGRKATLRLAEPLYFPERFYLSQTPPHVTGKSHSGRLAKLRRLPVLRELADLRNSSRVKVVNNRSSQSGYSFEAAEVQRCLKAGLLESPEMPLNDTLAVLETMDCIRSRWADRLPI